MNVTQVRKCPLAKLNDKKCYLSGSILSPPIGHPYMVKFRKYKKNSEENIQDLFLSNKYNLEKFEHKTILQNERLKILRTILLESVPCQTLDFNKRLQQGNHNNDIYTTTKDYILNSHWLQLEDDYFINSLVLQQQLMQDR